MAKTNICLFLIIELLKFFDQSFLFLRCWAIFEVAKVAKAVIVAGFFLWRVFLSILIKVCEVSETHIGASFSFRDYILNNWLCLLRWYFYLRLSRRWIRFTH